MPHALLNNRKNQKERRFYRDEEEQLKNIPFHLVSVDAVFRKALIVLQEDCSVRSCARVETKELR
jgi:hypothetical protein